MRAVLSSKRRSGASRALRSSASTSRTLDSSIRPGTQSVTYMLRTRRGDQVSIPSDAVTQHLGVPGNDGEQQGLTLAA